MALIDPLENYDVLRAVYERTQVRIRTLEHEMDERGIRTGMIHDALESAKAHIREQERALAQERETLDKLTAIAVHDTARLAEARELLTRYKSQHPYCSCIACERTAAWLKEGR